ncbi:M15 family metallopeptidase [Pontiella desulfatans]|nr:M15 family metallopeptidase [Pontiella desulfatans]
MELEDEGRTFLLQPNTAESWKAMKAKAASDGIHLYMVSAFRSIERQSQIIENKKAKGIPDDEIYAVSAPPGRSEHHTGRAIDLNTVDCPVLEEEFEDTPAFEWLRENAASFGFTLSYPRNNPYGIAYEPWHWKFRGNQAFETARQSTESEPR